MENTIDQVEGHFPGDAALQDAVGRLTRLGFDRAALSLPVPRADADGATPEGGATNPNMEDDQRQARTLGSSTAAAAAAMLGAGVVVATGGAALAAVAAAAGGAALAGGGVFAATNANDVADHTGREAAAASGELVLAVTTHGPEESTRAQAAMREAGATRVNTVRR
jgi:hypothetical protein